MRFFGLRPGKTSVLVKLDRLVVAMIHWVGLCSVEQAWNAMISRSDSAQAGAQGANKLRKDMCLGFAH